MKHIETFFIIDLSENFIATKVIVVVILDIKHVWE